MNRAEWAVHIASIRAYWPTADRWKDVTIGAYFEDVSEFASDEVGEALLEIRRSGKSSPPNGGLIRKAVLDRRRELGITSAAPSDGNLGSCRCHEDWQACEASGIGHTPGWFDRRRMEQAAGNAIAQAQAKGEEIDPYAYPGIPADEIHVAMLSAQYREAERVRTSKPGPIETAFLAMVDAGLSPRDALAQAVREVAPSFSGYVPPSSPRRKPETVAHGSTGGDDETDPQRAAQRLIEQAKRQGRSGVPRSWIPSPEVEAALRQAVTA